MKLLTVLLALCAGCGVCMIIPGLDEIVYLTESIEDFRNAKGQEGLGQQETGNFHLQEPKVVYKAGVTSLSIYHSLP